MRMQWALSGATVLAVAQIAGSLAIATPSGVAAADNLVMVLVGEKSRQACEVRTSTSDNDVFNENEVDGPYEVCPSGVVYGEVETRASATSARASSTASQPVRIVPLTGNADADAAAVAAEAQSIHNELYAQQPQGAVESGHAFGFFGLRALPYELLTPGAAATSASTCQHGKVGQHKMVEFRVRMKEIFSTTKGEIRYKRASCKHWNINKVRMTLTVPPDSAKVWFRNFYYDRAWFGGNLYGERGAGKQCWEVYDGSWTNFEPNWLIKADGLAAIEMIDANPTTPGVGASCWAGAGTSYVGFDIPLKGGTR